VTTNTTYGLGHTRVAGVDGCRGGWAVALDGEVLVLRAFKEVLALDVEVIAVDMPIGLPEAGPRGCDVDARRRLGPRRSSVFPAPVRAVLHERSYTAALALHRATDGRGLSKQAFHLLPKIAEVDAQLDPRVIEAHPELAFARLLGVPARHSKRSPAGHAERLAALGLGDAPRVRGAARDDVLDAIALTHIGRRFLVGDAEPLGDGRRDRRGLPMVIWA
jgi:predicted RNase H-like nuclease